MAKKVAIIMGSDSDLPVVKDAAKELKNFGVEFEIHVMSAHRTPEAAAEFSKNAAENGFGVIIAAAGMAAHLGEVIAAHTILPVIGIPMASEPFHGWDALLAMVQMPPGIPVATVTAGPAGAKNAALLAVAMLALSDRTLAEKLKEFRAAQTRQVQEADASLQDEIAKL